MSNQTYVALLGNPSSGKTHVIEQMVQASIGADTRSSHHLNIRLKKQISYIDVPSFFSPLSNEGEGYKEQELLNQYLQDFVISISQCIMVVVSEFSLADQKLIEAIEQSPFKKSETKFFIIHNMSKSTRLSTIC